MNFEPRSQSGSWNEEKEQAWREANPRAALLADDLAKEIGDPTSLRFYRWCALRFQEDYLRRIAAYVKEIPDAQVHSTRGAIFSAMIKKGGVHEYRPRWSDEQQ